MTTLVPVQPITYGPTWNKGEDGKYVLPDLTLGWDVIDWCERYLLQPDGPDAGEPWRFTAEQQRFVLWWYAVDSKGRFRYRSGMFRRMKGHGKDPLVAALCCVEFVGPCRAGKNRSGQIIAVPHSAAWVQVAAVSKDQTRNTMTLFPGMLSKKAIEEYSIDLGKEIIYAHRGRCRIEAVTSSPRALEGGRATFTIKNEPHHWIQSNEGTEMSAVIARNAAKSRDGSSRVLAISNAHAPGENSDAEHDYEAWMKLVADGRAEGADFIYDSIEAPEYEGQWPPPPDVIRAALEACRGDSVWLDVERLTAEILDPRTSKSLACRYYFNQLHHIEGHAFDIEQWNTLHQQDVEVPADALITLGFDGSLTNDHTALIGTHVPTGYQWVVGYWEPSVEEDGEVKIPVGDVDATVRWAFEHWNVWRMHGDPYRWHEYMAKWAGEFDKPGQPRVVSWATTNRHRMASSVLAYRNAIQESELTHDGDARFTAAIANCRKEMQLFRDDLGEQMWTITKEHKGSPLKIDAAVAAVLSWQARLDAMAKGAVEDDGESIYESERLLTL